MTKSINISNGVLTATNDHGNTLRIENNACTLDGVAHGNRFTIRKSDFYTPCNGDNIHFSYCGIGDDEKQKIVDFLTAYNASKDNRKKVATTRKTKKAVEVVVLTAYKTLDDYKNNNEYALRFTNARNTTKSNFVASIQAKINELVLQRKAELSFWEGVNNLDDKQAEAHLIEQMTAHNKQAEVAEKVKTSTTAELATAVYDLEAEVARLKAELAQAQGTTK